MHHCAHLWDQGSHTEQHYAQLLMQHVTQPATRECFIATKTNMAPVATKQKAAAVIVLLLLDD